ncbi:hypothetical protein [Microcoleus sp. D3_18a_C4]
MVPEIYQLLNKPPDSSVEWASCPPGMLNFNTKKSIARSLKTT